MELEIQEALQNHYVEQDKIKIIVEYEDIRKYKIEIIFKDYKKKILKSYIIRKSYQFYFNWIVQFTFASNISQLVYMIDKILKEELKDDKRRIYKKNIRACS